MSDPSQTSALLQVFRGTVVTYEAFDDDVSTDRFGNPVEVTTKKTFVAFLRNAGGTTRNQLLELEANTAAPRATYYFEGRSLDPVFLPPEVKTGSRCTATVNGEAGTLFIYQHPPSPVQEVADILGEKFSARWVLNV